jgi:transcriptional regulator with XRE-family HTH domain
MDPMPNNNPHPRHNQIAKIVKVLLAVRDLDQKDLASRFNGRGGTTSLSRSMNGHRKWTIEDLEEMASFFDVPVATFFEDVDRLGWSDTGRDLGGRSPAWLTEDEASDPDAWVLVDHGA